MVINEFHKVEQSYHRSKVSSGRPMGLSQSLSPRAYVAIVKWEREELNNSVPYLLS